MNPWDVGAAEYFTSDPGYLASQKPPSEAPEGKQWGQVDWGNGPQWQLEGMPSKDSFVDKAAGLIPYAGAGLISGGAGLLGAAGAGAGAALDPTGLAAADVGFNSAGQLGMGGALGASGAAALGLDPTGLGASDLAFNPQGQVGLAPSSLGTTPTMAARPAQVQTAGAGATAPVTSAAGAAQGGGNSFVDSLLKQMKDNALGLGLMTAGTAASLGAGRTPMPNQQQLQGLGAEASATAQQLLQQYRSGALSAGQQASLDQITQGTKNQLRQYFASTGQADSTAAVQAMAQVDQAALGMKQQMLDTALQQGLSAIGIAQGPLNTIAQYQLGQDQQLKQAFGNFAGGVGGLFGRVSGSVMKPTATNTTPNPVITSTQSPSPQMP